jgi:hypothetical protein
MEGALPPPLPAKLHLLVVYKIAVWPTGLRYAMLLMKTIVSTVLRHYKVTTSLKIADILLKVDILLKSVRGFPVALEPRPYNN